MELVKVIDMNGNETGEVIDKIEAHNQNLLHLLVAAFILNNKKQILLQKRSSTKKYDPNKWGLCSGHVKSTESIEDAIVREIKEEIGLYVPEHELNYFEQELILRNNNSHLVHHFYVIVDKPESFFTPQLEEVSEVKWFDIDEVIDRINNKDSNFLFSDNRLSQLNELKEKL